MIVRRPENVSGFISTYMPELAQKPVPGNGDTLEAQIDSRNNHIRYQVRAIKLLRRDRPFVEDGQRVWRPVPNLKLELAEVSPIPDWQRCVDIWLDEVVSGIAGVLKFPQYLDNTL